METKKTNLAHKMAKAMAGVKRIRKSGFNDFHKYAFATSEDVSDLIRELLAEHGVMFLPSMEEITQTKPDGSKNLVTKIKFTMRFIDGDSGECLSSAWFSEAADSSDKGINKCATAAVKYFLLKTFLVSSGDEVDPDEQSPSVVQSDIKPVAPEQIKTMQALVEKLGGDWQKFGIYCRDKYGASPDGLDAQVAGDVIAELQTRAARPKPADKVKNSLRGQNDKA